MSTPEHGDRFNAGKLRYDLIPPDALADVARVYTYGANKYEPRNWEKGLSWSDTLASLERHVQAFKAGEDRDAESGLPHMAHVAWNALTLLAFASRGTGTDDRVPVVVNMNPFHLPLAGGGSNDA